MKTSINIPEWLHDKVTATCPGVPFGTLARDALIIALPEWDRHGPDGAAARALEVELRLLSARAAQAGVTLPQTAPARQQRARPRATPTPPPAAPPTRRKSAARKSPTKVAALESLPGLESP